jgi:transcriptional regulator with XRE-family HTH domain
MDKKIFATNIKALRKSIGMKQWEFAEFLGMTLKNIGAWEEGRSWPLIPILFKISDYFGIDARDLLTKELNQP